MNKGGKRPQVRELCAQAQVVADGACTYQFDYVWMPFVFG
jgi:hypothetical protein